jgi:hypothetical protein
MIQPIVLVGPWRLRQAAAMVAPPLRLAVLIDAENVPASDASWVFGKVATLGNPVIRRVYGNFTRPSVQAWVAVISQHGGVPRQCGHTSSGRNASDIALVIDAMDILHAGIANGFCIVTSDGDFTGLAIRIREHGLKIFGFAHNKMATSLRAACDEFWLLDAPSATAQIAAAKTGAIARHPERARADIERALAAHGPAWMTLSALGTAVRQHRPTYQQDTGFASLKKLIEALGSSFELGTAANGKTAQVRLRPR